MSLKQRYTQTNGTLDTFKLARDSMGALFVAILLIAFQPFKTVPTGSRGVITQFGQIMQVKPEGLVILFPWEQVAIFNIRAEAASIDNAIGSTRDTQPVNVSLTVRYSIYPDKVAEVYEKYSHDGNLSSYIETAAQEVFKAVTAKYTAPELISKRAQVSSDINVALKNKVKLYGAQIINIDMRNFSFSADYMKTIGEKVRQEQLRLVAENKLLTVEAEQKQKVVVAEADAAAIKAKADGDAYAALKNATAQADSIKVQSAALAQNKDILELRRIEVDMRKASRWNGALPSTVLGSSPMPFMKIEQ